MGLTANSLTGSLTERLNATPDAIVRCLQRSVLLLSKEAPSDGFPNRHVGTKAKEVGHTRAILPDQRQGPRTAAFSVRPGFQQRSLSQPSTVWITA